MFSQLDGSEVGTRHFCTTTDLSSITCPAFHANCLQRGNFPINTALWVLDKESGMSE